MVSTEQIRTSANKISFAIRNHLDRNDTQTLTQIDVYIFAQPRFQFHQETAMRIATERINQNALLHLYDQKSIRASAILKLIDVLIQNEMYALENVA